jgi:hypothetical protein
MPETSRAGPYAPDSQFGFVPGTRFTRLSAAHKGWQGGRMQPSQAGNRVGFRDSQPLFGGSFSPLPQWFDGTNA